MELKLSMNVVKLEKSLFNLTVNHLVLLKNRDIIVCQI